MAYETSMNFGVLKLLCQKPEESPGYLSAELLKNAKKWRTSSLPNSKKLGILQETAVLDNVLDLTIEDILERRLQTIVFRKGLARTIFQSRQLITHGHITIDDRRVTIPGYIVPKADETNIIYSPESAVAKQEHPLRVGLSVVAKQPEIRQPARGGRRGGRGGRF